MGSARGVESLQKSEGVSSPDAMESQRWKDHEIGSY